MISFSLVRRQSQLTLQENPDLSDLARLHLLGKPSQQALSLPGLHRACREHLQSRLKPCSGILGHQFEHRHHHTGRIRETLPREGKHHPGQDSLRENLALRCDQLLDSFTNLSRVRVRITFGAGEIRYGRLIKRKAQQVLVIVERGHEGLNLLQGKGAEGGGEDVHN